VLLNCAWLSATTIHPAGTSPPAHALDAIDTAPIARNSLSFIASTSRVRAVGTSDAAPRDATTAAPCRLASKTAAKTSTGPARRPPRPFSAEASERASRANATARA